VTDMEKPSLATVRVEARSDWRLLDVRELWDGRELLWNLTWRDIRVRYKQTLLGAGWAVMQPVFQMIVMSVFFGGLLKVSSDNYPYAIFSFAALLPWNLFSSSLSGVSSSLVGNANLLTKVYFPRLVVPLSNVLARLVDFAIALVVFFVMMVYFGVPFTPALAFLPLYLLMVIAFVLGSGLILASLNVYYRDVQVLVGLFLPLLQMASPVVYSSSLVQGNWRWLYNLNPMAGVINGFRYTLLGSAPPDASIWISVAMTVVLLVVGLLLFHRTQRTMADVV
jgi:lipopolysaccharide transport system permease protein